MTLSKWICLDYETKSACDLKACGAYRYAIDPTTDILCAALGNFGGKAAWSPHLSRISQIPKIVGQALAEGWTWVAHNTAFERWIWQNIATPVYGWPECPPLERWHDTMSRALQRAYPAALEDALEAIGLPNRKDMEGSKLTISLSKVDKKEWIGRGKKRVRNPRFGMMPDLTEEILERVVAYCLHDIDDEIAMLKRQGWLPSFERLPWIISQEVNDRGIYLDMDYVEACQEIVRQALPGLEARFRAITGVNVSQGQKTREWLASRGVPLPNLQKDTIKLVLKEAADEDEVEGHVEAEDDSEDLDAPIKGLHLPEDVEEALRLRQLATSASLAKLDSMEACVGYDGRARGLLVYHGTTPGRQAAKLLQPHNFPKPTLEVDGKGHDPKVLVELIKLRDAELLEQVYGRGAVEIVVSGLRHAMAAEPGHVLLAGDFSGIQARTVLGVAGQYDKTELMASGVDVYIDMACDIWPELPRPAWRAGKDVFKPQVNDFKDRFPKQRGTGKNAVLGLGFQMGKDTFRTKYARAEPLSFCEGVVTAYRKGWAPKVPYLWYGLKDAATDAVWDDAGHAHDSHGIEYQMVDGDLRARLPDGSEIWYAHPQRTRDPVPWDPNERRPGFSYQVQKQGVWITRRAFGGGLTENIVMKIERQLMEAAKERLRANGFPIVLEVHDEIVAEVLKTRVDIKAFLQCMEEEHELARLYRIPVAVEPWDEPQEFYRK